MICISVAAFGQPFFDTASVKPADPKHRGTRMIDDPGTLMMNSASLLYCIVWAYDIKDYQVQGPDWIKTEIYDIIAKTETPVPGNVHKAMLQALLAERFKLTAHRETKDIPIYALAVGKNGPNFRASKTEGTPDIQSGRDGSLIGGKISMAKLADAISGPWMQRPVLDRTGLEGTYDLVLNPMPYLRDGPDGDGKPDMEYAIGRALQGLGLKLEPAKAPFEILVIDHVEKIPSRN